MRRRPAIQASTLVCACAVLSVAGCADSEPPGKRFRGKSADRIAAEAVRATRDAGSVRVTGAVRREGSAIGVDIRVDARGNCVGRMTGEGGRADIIRTGHTAYIRGNDKFWANAAGGREAAGSADRLAGRWVRTPAGQAPISGVCDKRGFLTAADGGGAHPKGMSKGETVTVDGKEVLALQRRTDDERTTVYVAAHGRPYIVKITQGKGAAKGDLNFTDYNEPVKATPPPADRVVEPAADLGGA
ncbi:hypothetical protein [Streptomyces sp. NPDC018031]|uniref:hypothetical protein n=1 Tax=Streptomyces sp. NPDC018031 TaxID=3365033 RepID=UPI00379CBC15